MSESHSDQSDWRCADCGSLVFGEQDHHCTLAGDPERCEDGEQKRGCTALTASPRTTGGISSVIEPQDTSAVLDYEEEKARWMRSNGSERLRLAAERGYKHDGIYRDERAAQELPGFVALPKAKPKEVVNPSAEAIEVETDTMSRVAALTPVHSISVRIVWVSEPETGRFGPDLPDGEYVMVDGYLGKHKLFRPVEEVDDDAAEAP